MKITLSVIVRTPAFSYYFGLSFFAGLSAVIDIDNDKDIVLEMNFSIDHIVWMGTQPTLKEKNGERVGITCTLPSDSLTEYF